MQVNMSYTDVTWMRTDTSRQCAELGQCSFMRSRENGTTTWAEKVHNLHTEETMKKKGRKESRSAYKIIHAFAIVCRLPSSGMLMEMVCCCWSLALGTTTHVAVCTLFPVLVGCSLRGVLPKLLLHPVPSRSSQSSPIQSSCAPPTLCTFFRVLMHFSLFASIKLVVVQSPGVSDSIRHGCVQHLRQISVHFP